MKHNLENVGKSRYIFEFLCDGNKEVALFLVYLKTFKKSNEMILYLFENKIRGEKILNLIKEKKNSHLSAVQYLFDKVSGNKFISNKLNARDLI